jgi:hypothetical protein
MRLTLRTLLAYLDNQLEPGDSQALAKKVEESKAAGELVHRIHEVTKKVRLGAPAVEGKGLGLDPNTVGEYIDSTMPADRVADFELVCLESDVHLAEVAACHEILSLVLVKPADFDPQMRPRMYALATDPAPQPALRAEPVPQTAVPVAAPIATPAAPATAPVEPARRYVVPDYLKQDDAPVAPRSGAGRMAAAIAAMIALVLIGTTLAMALAPNEKLPGFLQGMAASLFPGNVKSDDVAQGSGPGVGAVDDTSRITGAAAGTSPLGTAPLGTALVTGPAGTGTTGGISSIGPPAFAAPTPTSAGAILPPGAAAPAGLRQPASALVPAAVGMTATSVGTAPAPPVPSEIAPPSSAQAGAPPAGTAMAATGTGASPAAVRPGTAAPQAAVPAKIEPVGTYAGNSAEVLLRYDPSINGWARLQGGETLMVGDRLLALPGFRPQLAINGGVSAVLFGGTLVELSPVDPMGTCGLRILRGRLVAFNTAAAKAKLAIDDGKLRGICTLGGAEVGFEHVFRRPPGTDPAATEVPWILNLYVKSGDAAWASGAAPPATLPPTTTWTVSETAPPVQVAGSVLPDWIMQSERDQVERQAAEFIETNLRGPKAITVVLKETLADRRIENVQLALQCLAQLGDYDDFVPILRDPGQRYTTWERYLRWLTAAIDYGPFYAGRVREAFAKQHGAAGDQIYRMLWSFDDAQLAAGAAKELVETLDFTELDFRVVAYYTLVDVTGLQIAYTPQDTPTKRKQAAQKWEQKLQMGQIVRQKP